MARTKPSPSQSTQPSVFTHLAGAAPLAARMRPRTLDEVVGQRHLLAPGKALRAAVDAGESSPGTRSRHADEIGAFANSVQSMCHAI